MIYLLFEDLPFLEDLLHGHAGDDDSGFTFDDALDDVLDMASLSWDDSSTWL
jgi:hypothetical protein